MNLDNQRRRVRVRPILFLAALAVVMLVVERAGNIDVAFAIVRDPLSGVLAFASVQTDKIADALGGPSDLRAAQQEIEALNARIDQLERALEASQEIEGEYEQLLEAFNRSLETPQLTRLMANVIARDTSPTFRSLIIDRGTDDGVQVGMPVESTRGLVGQVFRATRNMAQVILITDNTSSIPGRLSMSRATGIVHGGGVGDALTLDWVDLEVQIAPGDTVLTSGLAGESPGGIVINRFPPGLVIGRVFEVQRSEAELFQRAILQPVTDFEALEIVFVITDAPQIDTSIFDEPGP